MYCFRIHQSWFFYGLFTLLFYFLFLEWANTDCWFFFSLSRIPENKQDVYLPHYSSSPFTQSSTVLINTTLESIKLWLTNSWRSVSSHQRCIHINPQPQFNIYSFPPIFWATQQWFCFVSFRIFSILHMLTCIHLQLVLSMTSAHYRLCTRFPKLCGNSAVQFSMEVKVNWLVW